MQPHGKIDGATVKSHFDDTLSAIAGVCYCFSIANVTVIGTTLGVANTCTYILINLTVNMFKAFLKMLLFDVLQR